MCARLLRCSQCFFFCFAFLLLSSLIFPSHLSALHVFWSYPLLTLLTPPSAYGPSIRAILVAQRSPGPLWSVVQNTGWELSAGNNKNIPLGAGQSLDRPSLPLPLLPLLLLGYKRMLPAATDAAETLRFHPAQSGHYWLSTLDTQVQSRVHLSTRKCLCDLFLVSHGVIAHWCLCCRNPGLSPWYGHQHSARAELRYSIWGLLPNICVPQLWAVILYMSG